MKKLMTIMAAAILSLSLAGCNISPKMGAGDTVLATAGDAKVYLRNFNYYIGAYKAEYDNIYSQLGYSAEDLVEYWLSEAEEGMTNEDQLKEIALENTQMDAVFYELGKAEGITYDKDTIDYYQAAVDSTVMSLASKESTGERAFYEMFFVTPDEFIEVEKNLSVVNQYKDMIKDSIEIEESEIQSYYDNNKEEISEYTVRHILIKFDEEAEDEETDKAAAYERAEEILAMAQGGEDFGVLAGEYSEDGGSKDNNGEYTIDVNTNFVQPFKDWTFTADIGEMGIVETEYGYHVMYLVSISEYEDHVESITSKLKEARGSVLLEQIHEGAAYEWVINQDVYDSVSIAGFTNQ